eukprot:gnl/TRDRNA2_/TRDRNA2_137053_c0_seq3.p1 gnl/TRDRNA2_/TRDRNA2_137053_c0~~gnl/TRDRNA2_/TRDRNA2_137053_c0_seq3.p1  ORF type:complete len:332 (+),score=63.13 gnl/TRDRNA2_/TRDRNA2_137053_c0_seq3:77-1072(+)
MKEGGMSRTDNIDDSKRWKWRGKRENKTSHLRTHCEICGCWRPMPLRRALEEQERLEQEEAMKASIEGHEDTSQPLRAFYVTGNEGKYLEAQHIVKSLRPDAVQLVRLDVNLPEIQGNASEIAKFKANVAATEIVRSPEHCRMLETGEVRFIIVDDSGVGLDCLNGFPGVYIKPMLESIRDVGLSVLTHRFKDHGAMATCSLGIIDFGKVPSLDLLSSFSGGNVPVEIFRGELHGTIVEVPKGTRPKVGWNSVFKPDGCDKVFAKMKLSEHTTISHRKQAFACWLNEVMPLATDGGGEEQEENADEKRWRELNEGPPASEGSDDQDEDDKS